MQIGIMCAIFANALSLACIHDGQTMAWIRAFDVIDKVFTSVFTLGEWLARSTHAGYRRIWSLCPGVCVALFAEVASRTSHPSVSSQ